ncbi:unnamed protein product [Scytosiphon promiscuus]
MRIPRPWSGQSSCNRTVDPSWPFAYSKHREQEVETKGRTNTNLQDQRHQCDRRGVRSKCHVCEDIACGEGLNSECSYQLQGVNASMLATNVPVVSDTPWAVGGSHRNDFGAASVSRVCMMLSGGTCLEPFGDDYSNCVTRCWGAGFSGTDASPVDHVAAPSSVSEKSQEHIPTVAWEYPKALTSSYGPLEPTPAFNPQGYVFTLAGGSGNRGYADGSGSAALFNDPQDVAVDADANVYVADTGNHRIRRISSEGVVTTVAGDGEEGFDDGDALEASFSYPGGIALYYDSSGGLVVYVADTNNHRLRKISGDVANGAGTVTCLAGRCGNGTESATRMAAQATPEAGFADGHGALARFDGPSGLAAAEDGTIFLADTNNHLVRMVLANSTVFTLAGGLDGAEVEAGGAESCPSPCLRGVAGHADGNLTEARFNFPADVSLGPNNTLFVADLHSLRRISMPESPTTILGVGFDGRVSTAAGGAEPGEADGTGPEARFSRPSGVTSTVDGAAYLTDAASCHLRRVAPTVSFAAALATCNTTLAEVLRPSGCSSYDPPQGGDGLTASPLSGNVWYNHWRNDSTLFRGEAETGGNGPSTAAANASSDPDADSGRAIRQCVGHPPAYGFDRADDPLHVLVVADGLVGALEDTGVGTTVRLACPAGCLGATPTVGGAGEVRGSPDFYTDDSAVCMAAVHAGVLTAETPASPRPPAASSSSMWWASSPPSSADEYVVVVARLVAGNASDAAVSEPRAGFEANGVSAGDAPGDWARGFALEAALPSELTGQTVAGRPAGPLGEGCGEIGDGQPPQEAVFGRPAGIDAWWAANITDQARSRPS